VDRIKLEYEWMESLKQLNKKGTFPISIMWGEKDTVNPLEIPKSLMKRTGM
jgi:hypothetical protein